MRRRESSVCAIKQLLVGAGGGGLKQNCTTKSGPERSAAWTEALEPGRWHNCPITTFSFVYLRRMGDAAKHREEQIHTKSFHCQTMNDQNTKEGDLEGKFSGIKTFTRVSGMCLQCC